MAELFNNVFNSIKKTVRASYHWIGQYTLPLEGEEETTPQLNTLTWLEWLILGIPFILTTIFLSVSLIPLVGNSWQRLKQVLLFITGRALSQPNHRHDDSINNDSLLRKIYGIPGYLLGTVLGLLAAMLIIGGRIIKSSAIQAAVSFLAVFEMKKPLENDRTFYEKYILGAPGWLLGGLVAGLLTSIILLIILPPIIIVQTWRTGSYIFKTLANVLLYQDNRFNQTDDERSAALPYDFGPGFPGLIPKIITGIGSFSGLILGIIAGIGSWPFIAVARVANQTFRSWKAFSSLLLNIAWDREQQDTNPQQEETIIGIMGYPLALLTTLPVAAGIYFVRKTSLFLFRLLSVIVSPIIFLGKVLNDVMTPTPKIVLQQNNGNNISLISSTPPRQSKSLYDNLSNSSGSMHNIEQFIKLSDNGNNIPLISSTPLRRSKSLHDNLSSNSESDSSEPNDVNVAQYSINSFRTRQLTWKANYPEATVSECIPIKRTKYMVYVLARKQTRGQSLLDLTKSRPLEPETTNLSLFKKHAKQHFAQPIKIIKTTDDIDVPLTTQVILLSKSRY